MFALITKGLVSRFQHNTITTIYPLFMFCRFRFQGRLLKTRWNLESTRLEHVKQTNQTLVSTSWLLIVL